MREYPLFTKLAKSEIIHHDGYTLFLRSDDIIQIQIKDFFTCEIEDTHEILNGIKKISNGKNYPILAIYSDFNSFSKETNELIAKHALTVADGLVINSMASRLVGNFYMKTNKPVRPTRLFNETESAVIWLKTFL